MTTWWTASTSGSRTRCCIWGLKSRTSVRNATLQADVTVRSLSDIEVSGAGHVHLNDDLAGGKLDITASGASGIDGIVGVEEASV